MPFCPAGLCMNAGSSSTTTWSKSPTGSCSQRWSTSRWAQLWSLLPAWCVHVSTAGYNVCVCVCVCVCVWQRAGDLADMITRVIREGLEGLVLKDIKVSCFLSPMETVCVWTWWCWSCVCVCVSGQLWAGEASLAEGEEGLPERGGDGRHSWPGGAGSVLWKRLQRSVNTNITCSMFYIYIYIIMCVLSCRQQLLSGSAQLLPVRRAGWRHVVWSFHEKTLD